MVIKILNQNNNSVQKQDPFAKLLGEFGRWQFLVLATVSLVKLSSGWVQMAILFLTPKLTFICVNRPNSTEELLNNTCYEDCVEYKYDASPFDNTIVSEWDLICERRWLASFTQMMLQLGVLVGSVIFGFLSDRKTASLNDDSHVEQGQPSESLLDLDVNTSQPVISATHGKNKSTIDDPTVEQRPSAQSTLGLDIYGRKNTFLVAISTVIIFGLAIPFSPNYIVFTALRTLLGMATAGTMVVSFVIVMESVGPRYREVAGCLFQIPFIIGHMTVPLFAYYFRSWNQYTLALGIPPLIYLGYFFTLSESPRWLVSQGRVEEATKIVKKAASMNNLPTSKIEDTLTKLSQEIRKNSKEPRLNYSALFQKSLVVKTACCSVMWFVVGVIFFGFNQYISQTSPDPFLSVALAGVIQIPSNLLSIWLIRKLGRRLTISVFYILGGVFVIVLYFVPKIFAVTLTLGTLGVSCAAIVAASIYIYTSELYPTVVRNMGIGASSTSMRVGSMLAPFISDAGVSFPWMPTAIFGVAALVAGLVCLLLPETKGTTLPDSIEDVQNAK